MKILYINPPRLESGLDAIIKGEPLSLISIAAMVPEHDAKLFDFKVEKNNENRFLHELNRNDIVAITSMTPQISYALEVAEKAKKQGCITIIGGYQPTLAPNYVIKNQSVDYIVRGEGEHTFKELIDYIDGNKNQVALKDIDGISYKNKSGIIKHNNERCLEPNLDNFAMPRRDLLDEKKYIYLGARIAQLETSRGCPHNCKFCCIIKMWKDPSQHIVYRSKSVSRIMREIYNIGWKKDFIFFCEDNFTIQVKRTKKILDAIIKSGVQNKVHFSCQSRVDTLYKNPWLIELMREAGMKQVFLGIESVHQQSLDAMNKKNTTPKKVKIVVKALQDRGISIFGGVIIGFPGETKTMVRQNINYAKSLNMTIVQFTPITAFPGTEFHQEMQEKGMITTNDYKYYDLFHPMMRTDKLTTNEIFQLAAEAYSSYYLGSDWVKSLAKRYLNPFGKFNWMSKNIPRFIKTVIVNGLDMLYNMGIGNTAISDELKEMIAKTREGKSVIPETPLKTEEKEESFVFKHELKEKAIISNGY